MGFVPFHKARYMFELLKVPITALLNWVVWKESVPLICVNVVECSYRIQVDDLAVYEGGSKIASS